MSEEYKNLIRFNYEEFLNRKNLGNVEQYFTGDTVFRCPGFPETRGIDNKKQLILSIQSAFPDICYTVDNLIAEGDTVVALWRSTGTQKGEWLGIQPAGKQFLCSGISVFRISDGKIAEEYVEWDASGMLQQLQPAAATSKSKAKPRPKAKPKPKVKSKAKPKTKSKKKNR